MKSCSCKNCSCGPDATFFAALASTTRLEILAALTDGPRNVSEIARITGEEQSAVSHALAILADAGLVAAEREGKYSIYTLKKQLYAPLMEMAKPHIDDHKKTLSKKCCCAETP